MTWLGILGGGQLAQMMPKRPFHLASKRLSLTGWDELLL